MSQNYLIKIHCLQHQAANWLDCLSIFLTLLLTDMPALVDTAERYLSQSCAIICTYLTLGVVDIFLTTKLMVYIFESRHPKVTLLGHPK